jgi:hypothetical protein
MSQNLHRKMSCLYTQFSKLPESCVFKPKHVVRILEMKRRMLGHAECVFMYIWKLKLVFQLDLRYKPDGRGFDSL